VAACGASAQAKGRSRAGLFAKACRTAAYMAKKELCMSRDLLMCSSFFAGHNLLQCDRMKIDFMEWI
jgi:hypothetical protein